MKKQFTTALVMAAAITSAHAQVLDFDGSVETKFDKAEGVVKCDTVNWYWNEDEELPGSFEPAAEDADAPNKKALHIETTSTCNPWERCLKFDRLAIKPGTIYRVKVSAKAEIIEKKEGSVMQIAMLRGDENCDMPWVAKNANGGKEEFRYNVADFSSDEYSTATGMFYYTSNELQEEFYGDYNKNEAMPDNQFLRLTINGQGEYWIDRVLVEEAPIAGVYFGGNFSDESVIKVDFGFPTNAAKLAKENGGTKQLDAAMFTVKVNDEVVTPESVELKTDGGLYIFLPEGKELDYDTKVEVSFNNTDCGLNYAGALTPGDGKAVMSFTAEQGQYQEESFDVVSSLQEAAVLVSSYPLDGSFEMDEETLEYSFTFNKDVKVKVATATIEGAGFLKPAQLDNVSEADENGLGRTIKFKLTGHGTKLEKGSYTIYVEDIVNKVDIDTDPVRIDFEVGKVQVAEIEYTPVETKWLPEDTETNAIPTGWVCYKQAQPTEEDPDPTPEACGGGSSCRSFRFAPEGVSPVGFYICDRDDARWTLVYGLDTDNGAVHLPAGDIDFGVTAVGWQGKHPTVEWSLRNFDTNEEVATGMGTLENTVGAAGEAIMQCDRINTKFNLKEEGNYVLTIHNRNDINDGAIILGYDVKTYKMSAGATSDGEVLINEDFSSVANGAVPAQGEGWTIYDNGNPAIKGEGQSGRNRIMDITTCEGLTKGFYNRCFGDPAAYNMTYGEMEADEPSFEMDAVKYNFSWYACNWKGDKNTYYFQILDEDGNVVYEREDEVTASVEDNAQQAVAQKIEFTWTPREAGRYILNWYMTGESVVGRIKVEQMGSLAVFYRNLLNEALAVAKEERENAADDLYAGKTRDALDAAIAEASNPNFHTGAEYMASIEKLNSYVEAMKTRVKAMAEYDKVMGSCASLLEELAETKYEKLEAYQQLKALYEQYNETEASSLEDEVLLPVQNTMTTAYDYMVNMKNSVVDLYTAQINRLVGQLAAMDEEGSFDEENYSVILAAGEAVSDDQEIAVNLQKMVTAAIYSRIAAEGDNFFVQEDDNYGDEEEEDVDPELGDGEPQAQTYDMTGYIQNADIYAVPLNTKDWSFAVDKASTVFPGWSFTGGNVNYGWGWGEEMATATKVAVEAKLCTPWGGSFKASQVVKNLPVGTYIYKVDTGDGSHIGEYDAEENIFTDGFENKSTIYFSIDVDGEPEETTIPFNLKNSNPWRGMATCESEAFDLPVGAYELPVAQDLTIGAAPTADGDFAQVDNFRLELVGKLDGFDYAAAAAKLKGEIETAIKAIKVEERTTAPISTVYYTVGGQQTTAPKGLAIKVERWADGYIRVTKTLVK